MPVTHVDQAVSGILALPWRKLAPEKRWCRQGVRAVVTDLWLAHVSVQSPTGSPGRRPEYNNQAVTADLHSDSLACIQTPLLADLPSPLTLIRQNSASRQTVASPSGCVACPRKLVCQCLGGHHAIGFGFLLVKEASGLITETPGEVGCFDECPHQVGITIPGVAFAFFLAIRITGTVYTAGVGSKIAHFGKASDRRSPA